MQISHKVYLLNFMSIMQKKNTKIFFFLKKRRSFYCGMKKKANIQIYKDMQIFLTASIKLYRTLAGSSSSVNLTTLSFLYQLIKKE